MAVTVAETEAEPVRLAVTVCEGDKVTEAEAEELAVTEYELVKVVDADIVTDWVLEGLSVNVVVVL